MRVLNRGATAEVRIVSHEGLDVVEKRLLPHAAANAEARADLEREGHILHALAGRGAPRWIAGGDDDAGPFVRLACGPLTTLASIGTSNVRAHFDSIARAAFSALAQVHDAVDDRGPLRIVHGDLSAPNVLVSPGFDQCWLVDFQLASFRDGAPPRDGAFRGTLDTVAPEVAHGAIASARSDVFALAATLVSAALGRSLRPPRGSGDIEAVRIVRAAEEPLVWDVSELDTAGERVRGLLVRCLAHDASARPETAAVALAALEPVAR